MESVPITQSAPSASSCRLQWWPYRAAGSLSVLGAILVWLGMLPRLVAAQPAALPPADLAISTKSVFTDDPKFGQDPFFPHSIRRGTVVPVNTNAPLGAMPDLVLKGISGGKDRRLALLNNRTVEVGEELEMNHKKVRCVEIRERSVVISIDGQSKEIFLRQNL